MAVGQWFYYDKLNNSIDVSSVEFISILPFLRGKNFKFTELLTFKNDVLTALLNENESPSWIQTNHHIYLSDLLENNFHSNICYATIELEQSGLIVFNHGRLYVKYPLNESLKEIVTDLLVNYGYYAGNLVWDFYCNNDFAILLDFILCIEEFHITDEFDRMIEYSRSMPYNPFS